MPPSRSLFFKLTPSMNTLTWLAVDAPDWIPLPVSPSLYFTPGASAANDRKLRSVCGRERICAWLTLVAISLVRVSVRRLPVTTMSLPLPPAASGVAPGGATVASSEAVWPIATVMSWVAVCPSVAVEVT